MYIRNKEVEKEYQEYLKSIPKGYNCFTDNDKRHLIIEQWKNWALRVNEYPYEGVKEHAILYPIRPCKRLSMLMSEEEKELNPSIEKLLKFYDNAIMNGTNKTSVNNHFHIHLIKE